MSEKYSPFDYWKSIQTKEYMEDLSGFDKYLLEMLLSSHSNYIFAVNSLNRKGSHKLSKRAVYDYYYYLIPKNTGFLKFPKKEKANGILKLIQRHFKLNESAAKEYYQILEASDIERLKEMYDN